MGFLNNIFSENPEPEKSPVKWIALTSMAQLDEITNVSNQGSSFNFQAQHTLWHQPYGAQAV
jgi:hypothetical protein